jgi:hypothetical protein
LGASLGGGVGVLAVYSYHTPLYHNLPTTSIACRMEVRSLPVMLPLGRCTAFTQADLHGAAEENLLKHPRWGGSSQQMAADRDVRVSCPCEPCGKIFYIRLRVKICRTSFKVIITCHPVLSKLVRRSEIFAGNRSFLLFASVPRDSPTRPADEAGSLRDSETPRISRGWRGRMHGGAETIYRRQGI